MAWISYVPLKRSVKKSWQNSGDRYKMLLQIINNMSVACHSGLFKIHEKFVFL